MADLLALSAGLLVARERRDQPENCCERGARLGGRPGTVSARFSLGWVGGHYGLLQVRIFARAFPKSPSAFWTQSPHQSHSWPP